MWGPAPAPPAFAERAVAVKDWVADPVLKSFIGRAADQGLDDLLWLESVVALLAQKPPSGCRDDDRAGDSRTDRTVLADSEVNPEFGSNGFARRDAETRSI